MSLLTVSSLSKSFGQRDIFSGVSISIPYNARIAIVGPNGIGKTTLLRVLVGIEEPTSGTFQRMRGLKTGYLPQEASLTGKNTLWEECLGVMADLRLLEAELASLEASMSDPLQAEAALERYGQVQVNFERRGGYTYETRIRQTLAGLGFDIADFSRPVSQLSGGQRTRAFLARLLLSDPDLLILDEPTNHLDVDAREALIQALNAYSGAVLIVSHDRHMLEMTADRLVLVDGGTAKEFDGSIDDYIAFVLAKDPAPAKGDNGARGVNRKDQRKANAEARERSQDLRKRARSAEAELEKLTAQRSAVDRAMFDPASADAALAKLTMTDLMKRRATLEAQIEAAEAAWLEASEALESFA